MSSAHRQGEASLLTGLFVHSGVVLLDKGNRGLQATVEPGLVLGICLCDAFEAYLSLHPEPQLSFEWAWNLYRCLVARRELEIAWKAFQGPSSDELGNLARA